MHNVFILKYKHNYFEHRLSIPLTFLPVIFYVNNKWYHTNRRYIYIYIIDIYQCKSRNALTSALM